MDSDTGHQHIKMIYLLILRKNLNKKEWNVMDAKTTVVMCNSHNTMLASLNCYAFLLDYFWVMYSNM